MSKTRLGNIEIHNLLRSKELIGYLDNFNGLPVELVSEKLGASYETLINFVTESNSEEFALYLGAPNTWYIRALADTIKYPTPYIIDSGATYYKLFGSGSVKVGFKGLVSTDGLASLDGYLPVINRFGDIKHLGTAYKLLTYPSIDKLIDSTEVLYLQPGLCAIKLSTATVSRL